MNVNPKPQSTAANKQIEDLQYALARERSARLGSERKLLKLTSELGHKSVRLNEFVKDFNQLVEEKGSELHAAHRAAMELVNAKNEFIANITHELRTPLNGVIGIFTLLQDIKHLSQDEKELVSIGMHSAEHLRKIINQILDFSKHNASKDQAEASVINLKETFQSICSAARVAIEEKGIVFETAFAFADTDCVVLDSTPLRQLVDNLLDNAAKFTPAGGCVSIQGALEVCAQHGHSKDNSGQVYATAVDESAPASAQMANATDGDKCVLTITVTDTGIGLSPAQQQSIFNAYAQAESDITKRFGGTGLGLYIVKTIVDNYGGEVVVQSELEEGSTFTVRLPVIYRADGNVTAVKNEDSEALGAVDSFEGLRVLVVEDNETNQLITRKSLERWSIEVHVASRGQEAIALAQERLFDLILMDIDMPEMNGFETTRVIKQSGGLSVSAPVVAITAHCSEEYIDACFKAGMVAHLPKPFTVQQLASTLDTYRDATGNGKTETESNQRMPAATLKSDAQHNGDQLDNCTHHYASTKQNEPKELTEMELTHMEQKTLDAALERLDGDHELLCRLASGMISQSLEFTQRLLQRMPSSDEDWQDVARNYHTLKGTSGNLGFDQIFQLAAALEVFVKERQSANIMACAKRLMTELQRAQRLVDNLKQRSADQPSEGGRFYDAELLKNKLLRVQALVATDVGEVDDMITELSQKAAQGAVCEQGQPFVEQLQLAMMQFDIKSIESICQDAVAALTAQEF